MLDPHVIRGVCVLCGVGPVTDEHAYPHWVAEIVTKMMAERTPFTVVRTGTPDRESDIINVVVRRVCHPCNTRWLNDIETEARPVLAPLITAAVGSHFVLSRNDRELLGLWAFKTALMLDFTFDTPLIPARWYSAFRGLRRPSLGSVVWVAGYGGEEHAVFARRQPIRVDPTTAPGVLVNAYEGLGQPDRPNGVITTFQAGRVVFQMLALFALPAIKLGSSTFDPLTIRTWPLTDKDGPVAWPAGGALVLTDGSLIQLADRLDLI